MSWPLASARRLHARVAKQPHSSAKLADKGSLMDVRDRALDVSLTKFGIGQPVPRSEDPRLLRGQGRYTDDIKLPGQAYAVIVRSRHAHGIIRGIDAEPARAMPGVLGINTSADLLTAGSGTLTCIIPP